MDTAATRDKHRGDKFRKNLHLTPHAISLMNDEARRRGITPTAVVEQAIRAYCAGEERRE